MPRGKAREKAFVNLGEKERHIMLRPSFVDLYDRAKNQLYALTLAENVIAVHEAGDYRRRCRNLFRGQVRCRRDSRALATTH